MPDTCRLAVQPVSATDSARAVDLAGRLHLPLLDSRTDLATCRDADAVLLAGAQHLALRRTGRDAPGPVSVDFGAGALRRRRGAAGGELLARAVGAGKRRSLRVIDATAGLGSDAFLLAGLGCRVQLCERNPVIAALLADGMRRALAGEQWLADTVSRMRLWQGDARGLAESERSRADVIYLDPMFPPRRKRAATGKEMALFRLLLGPGESAAADARALCDWALRQDAARVVVKRPLRAPGLVEAQPSHCLRGRAVRYDVFALRSLDGAAGS